MTTTILGVRHHGPGSARAVRSTLERLKPDIVLIEGPPEADALVPLAAEPDMEPPVALLAHVPGDPSKAAFWPFAVFSPEWQAIRYAADAGVEVRFCDLPAAHALALGGGRSREAEPTVHVDPIGALAEAAGYDDPERWWEDAVEHRIEHGTDGEAGHGSVFEAIAEAMAAVREGHTPDPHEARREAYMRRTLRQAVKDGFGNIAVVCGAWHVPALATLPKAADDNRLLKGMPKVKVEMTWVPWTHGRLAAWSGYGAGVTSPGWYHHLFTAPDRPIERWLARAAAVLRQEDLPVSSAHVIEAVRLAHGLATLRDRPLAGLSEVGEAVRAVLCEGDELPADLVHRRMVVGERLGHVPDSTPMVPLQRHLREEQRRVKLKPEALERDHDLDLRRTLDLDRSRLLHRLRLIGVPWGTPRETRGKGTFKESWTLEWRPEFDVSLIEAAVWGITVEAAATARVCELAGKSALVNAFGVHGAPDRAAGDGTAGDGTAGDRTADHTLDQVVDQADGAPEVSLAELTTLVEKCLLADLPDALPYVLRAIGDRAALDSDVGHLMAALPALVRAQRYGDVRGTPSAGLAAIVDSLLTRVCAGLPIAVTGLDEDPARQLVAQIDAVHSAVALLHDVPRGDGHRHDGHEARHGAGHEARQGAGHEAGQGAGHEAGQGAGHEAGHDAAREAGYETGRDSPRDRWLATLRSLANRSDLPGVIEGRLVRILFDAQLADDVQIRMSRAMSLGHPPARAAAWIEGFLSGGGLLLVHDSRLLAAVDGWLTGLSPEAFVDVLPLLRRTFGAFAAPERRSIGERVRAGASDVRGSGGRTGDGTGDGADLDDERAAPAVRTVLEILGRL
ncbi:DUF5682 family protein [Microtetraspora sp. NBRC 16547]|uniref:DUF5682 family protein n=1 Tax=Microtetraspora sp. NBRC 16547 TaxID=3030993 RepID=UPI0024A15C3E|nr:DUF5682 family protein [Microtetraspora sp. NBRC 16547]GLW96911.1 hypothetical protein Misp02_09980 [Microtetraspora sp. NBRC 16547]